MFLMCAALHCRKKKQRYRGQMGAREDGCMLKAAPIAGYTAITSRVKNSFMQFEEC